MVLESSLRTLLRAEVIEISRIPLQAVPSREVDVSVVLTHSDSVLAELLPAVGPPRGLQDHGTGAAENAPVLEDGAPRRQFRITWRGALSSNEGSKTIRGGRSHTQVKRSAKLEPQWLRTIRLRKK